MEIKVFEELAKEKVEFYKKELERVTAELNKWTAFIEDLKVSGIAVLSPEESNLQRNPMVVPKIDKPVIGFAEAIRTYFLTVKKKAPAKVIAAWVLEQQKAPKAEYNTLKPKIYSQLATFDRQKKCRQVKSNGKVYYEWIHKED